MHLCDDCRAERDWETGTQVDYLIKANLAKKEDDPSKARCRECTRIDRSPTFIRNPLFEICKKCAERLRQCQHCRKSTLPKDELDRVERHQALLDLFTVALKAFGLGTTKTLFRQHAAEIGIEDIGAFDRLSPGDLDARVDRPLWTKVLNGSWRSSPRWCEAHTGSVQWTKSLCRAERCSHWTIGQAAAWCALCAAEEHACETCGTSFE